MSPEAVGVMATVSSASWHFSANGVAFLKH